MATEENGGTPFVVFVSGITPAEIIYAPLLGVIGDEIQAHLKELEVFAEETPPPDYSFAAEVEGIKRVADKSGEEKIHLVGLSAGASAALFFAAKYPERASSLALIEPPRIANEGWSSEDAAYWAESEEVMALPPAERMGRFPRLVLGPGAEPPPRPSGPPPWMVARTAGMAAMDRAFREYDLDPESLCGFRNPVYLALGSLSNPVFEREAKRLRGMLPNLEVEVYEGRHHLDAPHTAEPERFARALRGLWTRAGTTAPAGGATAFG